MKGSSSSSSSMTSRRNDAALKCRKVNRVLARFAETHLQIREEYKAKGESVSQIKALNETIQRMRDKSQCENTKKQLGAIEGIKIGDRFRYRGELVVIGLHHQSIKGIDYMWEDDISFATSILVTNRKDNTIVLY
ncbi:YDG domain-containing protein At5g47150-like [Lotus japonicus]|uniref:YDG domain-containing protein At5g47150-like n=1 Tax=Lotus japonicus TaxID=34305 RepID=UPI002589446A|nr:YDG domain-containing protein At5g47150-like [Lotus japonicus]